MKSKSFTDPKDDYGFVSSAAHAILAKGKKNGTYDVVQLSSSELSLQSLSPSESEEQSIKLSVVCLSCADLTASPLLRNAQAIRAFELIVGAVCL